MARYTTHLELCTVNCLWQRPSPAAFACFDNLGQAATAMALLQSSPDFIDGHIKITGPWGPDHRPYLEVMGLHHRHDTARTLGTQLDEALAAIDMPRVIKMRRPTSRYSNDEVSTYRVRDLFLLHFPEELQSFSTHHLPTADGRYLRSVVGFTDRGSAVRAVERFNKQRFPKLGNAQLIITRRLAITYYASAEIVKAVEGQLQTLSQELKDTIQIDIIQDTTFQAGIAHDMTKEKNSATIQCWAEAESSIAHINAAIEKILTGDVIMDDKSPLWDPWFANIDGLADINKIASENNVHILRDLPASQLRLFGGLSASKPEIARCFLAAVASATRSLHCISLSQEMLLNTTDGGLARLQEKFGSAVILRPTGGSAGSPPVSYMARRWTSKSLAHLSLKTAPLPSRKQMIVPFAGVLLQSR